MTILEFSEEQQQFHYNNGRNVENSNGYKTLVGCEDDREASCFADFLFKQHLDGGNKARFATFKEMKATCDNLASFINAVLQEEINRD